MSPIDDLKSLIQIVYQLKGKRARDAINAIIFTFFASALGFIGITIIERYLHTPSREVSLALNILFVVLLSLSFIILLLLGFLKLFRNTYRVVWQSRNYERQTPSIDDWNFQGLIGVDRKNNAIWLTDSEAGCYLRSRAWRSCEITFQAKCENDSGFGILFRVQDLEHYWMFKINPNQNVSDHFRTERGWQILKQLPVATMSVNQWTDFKLTLEDDKVVLKINILPVEYYLPDSVILNSPFFPINIAQASLDKNILTLKNNYYSGSVGLRACGGEKVYFRNFKVVNPRYQSFRLTK